MSNKTIFVMKHTHKHGEDVKLFHSNAAPRDIDTDIVVAMLDMDFDEDKEEFIDIFPVQSEEIPDYDNYLRVQQEASVLCKKDMQRIAAVLEDYEFRMEENDNTVTCRCLFTSFDKEFIFFTVEEDIKAGPDTSLPDMESRNAKIPRSALRHQHNTNIIMDSIIDN